MKILNYYRYPHPNNVGDTLTPEILHHFLPSDLTIQQVREDKSPKLLGVGSIMRAILPGDTIWGTGVMNRTDKFPAASQCRFLAVRGKLSRDILIRDGGDVPEVYGDPAVLLPLMYRPEVEVTHKVGVIPHFVDKRKVRNGLQARKLARTDSVKVIDIFLPWQEFVKEVLSCEHIISSSLHGLIIAEAYGRTAEWVVLSHRVIGRGFKFRDYLTGTERAPQDEGIFPRLDEKVLAKQQQDLLRALLDANIIHAEITKEPSTLLHRQTRIRQARSSNRS